MSESVNGAAMERGTTDPPQATTTAQHLTAARVEPASRSIARAVPRTARGRRVLIIVENLPCPFDRRVMQEARTLTAAGYAVSIICPKAPGYEKGFENIDGIHIHRHALPREADGAFGYALEYGVALVMEFWLSLKVFFGRGFDVLHACNPPDTIFLIGRFYKLFGKKFLFDHHDINPELYETKFGRRGRLYRLIVALERWTFRTADVSIATNESYRRIALERCGMPPDRVFVVRSGPDLKRVRLVPANPALKRGRDYLVGYVGVMGSQDGLDILIDAWRLVMAEPDLADARLDPVGDGPARPPLEERVRTDDRLAASVRFHG